MPNITLALPQELYDTVRRHREIRWSEIARSAIREYVTKLKLLDEITKDSKLSEQDAIELGHQIKRAMAEHYTVK